MQIIEKLKASYQELYDYVTERGEGIYYFKIGELDGRDLIVEFSNQAGKVEYQRATDNFLVAYVDGDYLFDPDTFLEERLELYRVFVSDIPVQRILQIIAQSYEVNLQTIYLAGDYWFHFDEVAFGHALDQAFRESDLDLGQLYRETAKFHQPIKDMVEDVVCSKVRGDIPFCFRDGHYSVGTATEEQVSNYAESHTINTNEVFTYMGKLHESFLEASIIELFGSREDAITSFVETIMQEYYLRSLF